MIARGKRRGVPPLFAPAGPLNCRIGTAPVAASEPGAHYRARGPPRESPDQDRDAFAPQGRPTQAFLEALRGFMYWENYDVRVRMDGKIDRVVLDDILKRHRT